MKKMGLVLLGSVSVIGAAMADESSKGWSGEAELGVVMTTGNTETQTVSAKAKVENEQDKWRHKLAVEALNQESANQTTAERYNLSGQSNYLISERQYLFGIVTYEDDRFSGYDYRATEALGYGARVVDEQNLTVDVEAGLGARQSELDNNGGSEDEGVVRLAGNLAWEISDTSHFTEELTSEIGEDVTISKSVTALKTQINGSLAMKLSYTIKNTSEVPVGIEKTDTETAVTLVYGF